MSSLIHMLSGIVDYAGLFPPAKLELDQVVANFREYHQVSQSWMLGRLVIPAARLEELSSFAEEYFPQQAAGWKISALLPAPSQGPAFEDGVSAIEVFNRTFAHDQPQRFAVVDAVEVPAKSLDDIDLISRRLAAGIDIFFEIDHREDPGSMIEAISNNSPAGFAKIRTGGITADLIPSTTEVARFLHRCAAEGVGFKATAGLHHPIRHEFNLTYEADSPSATMHGFVNVFVAAALAFEYGLDEQVIEKIVNETNAGEFDFSGEQARWKDHSIDVQAIDRIRKTSARSFGSCSFEEPIQDLQQLGFGLAMAEAI